MGTIKAVSHIVLVLMVVFSPQCFHSFSPKKVLNHYNQNLRKLAADRLAASTVHDANATKQEGRVFYPIGYGADPTGSQDSSEAILSALNDAFKVANNVLVLLPGVNDLGGAVIDLQGGSYIVSQPIRFPASGGGNLVIKGGSLRASSTFPGDRHLIEVWSPSSSNKDGTEIYYEDITFRDLLLDSSLRGGGIYIVDSARIRINNCFFIHFTTQGILVYNGHETFISSSFLGQHLTVGGDRDEKYFSGTAIELASNDNSITDVAIFSAATGIVLRGQANMVTGVHCYNKATYFGGVGILVKLPSNSQTRINNCYMDYTAIVLEDPVQVQISNGFFLGDANVVLRSVQGRISGLNIVENMFSGDASRMKPIVKLEGEFTNIDQVVVDRNNVDGMSLKSTIGKLTVAGNGTKWVADFSSLLLFPNKINHLHYAFYVRGRPLSFPAHVVTDVTNNVVTVESDHAVDGVVSVAVDQYNMVGETSSFN
ncbi:hypothetical protein GIB67_041229 [Kingdonia uniflora]|uniref:Polygalacturonase QRT3 n=1 Tax=Kingdonia uniflora TaxID=39325 RepID=A0A7J7PAT4_9MAGN|nr:hypothetical protein GIB67_041229 [Kingdonia uniflora]